MSDSTCSVKLLMASRASWSCWFKEVMVRGDDGDEKGVEILEKMGEVWW